MGEVCNGMFNEFFGIKLNELISIYKHDVYITGRLIGVSESSIYIQEEAEKETIEFPCSDIREVFKLDMVAYKYCSGDLNSSEKN